MNSNQKLLAVVAAIGAAIVVYVLATRHPEEAKPAPTTEPSSAPVDTSPPPIMSAPKPTVSAAPSSVPTVAPTSVDLATAAYEAKMVTRAQAALDKGDYKQALEEIEDYEKIPNRVLLTPQATMIKITSLAHLPGRRTDALALAMETRTDDTYKDYHEQIESILVDAGLHE